MPRDNGRRAGLTRDRVLAVAGAIAAEDGLDQLTMRALALRLDVVPNALYRWVDSKGALLDALFDDTLSGVGPAMSVRTLLLDVFDALNGRPELAPLFLDRAASPGPNATRVRTELQRLLDATSATGHDAAAAVPILLVYVTGFASFVTQTHGAKLMDYPELGTPRDLCSRGVDWILAGVTSGHP